MKKVKKKAADFLPDEVQNAINAFIKQFNIMVEYKLDSIPHEYIKNMLEVIAKYPEYNKLLMDMIGVLKKYEGWENK